MNTLDRQNRISNAFKKIHETIFYKIKGFEKSSKILDDVWEKKDLGQGNSIVIDDGNFFDKAGSKSSLRLVRRSIVVSSWRPLIKFKL